MPEVCEVAITSLYLNDKLEGEKLEKIEVLGGKYLRKPLEGLESFNKILPAKIEKVDSKGKQMWFVLKSKGKNYYIFSHFGMEGRWSFDKEKHANIQLSFKKDGDLDKLYFVDHRNFGRLELITKKSDFTSKINELGPDFLKQEFDHIELKKRMENLICPKGKKNTRKWNKNIVKVLMEGQKANDGIGSGLGNYLTAEILYRATINPHTSIGSIYEKDNLVKLLAKSIKYTVKLSYMTNKTGYMQHIKDFNSRIRELVNSGKAPNYHSDIDIKNNKFEYLIYRKKKDPLGNDVKSTEIIKTRSMWYVPKIQVNPNKPDAKN